MCFKAESGYMCMYVSISFVHVWPNPIIYVFKLYVHDDIRLSSVDLAMNSDDRRRTCEVGVGCELWWLEFLDTRMHVKLYIYYKNTLSHYVL